LIFICIRIGGGGGVYGLQNYSQGGGSLVQGGWGGDPCNESISEGWEISGGFGGGGGGCRAGGAGGGFSGGFIC